MSMSKLMTMFVMVMVTISMGCATRVKPEQIALVHDNLERAQDATAERQQEMAFGIVDRIIKPIAEMGTKVAQAVGSGSQGGPIVQLDETTRCEGDVLPSGEGRVCRGWYSVLGETLLP